MHWVGTRYDTCMIQRKSRLTVTVDPELVEAANQAVAQGSADSLSGWVNAAMADRARRDERLERLRRSIQNYEAEFGEISADEIARQRRADRERSVVVRGARKRGKRDATA